MQRNGKIYCDFCNLEINRYQTSIRFLRDPDAGVLSNEYVHYHNRDDRDCYARVRETAEVLSQTRKPTADDFTAFEKWKAQEARKAVIQILH
jgi:hypothetical protein